MAKHRNPLKALGKSFFYHLGGSLPTRGERFLLWLGKTISRFYPKKARARKKYLLDKKLHTLYYGAQVLRTARHIGKEFYCGGPSRVTRKTTIGDYSSFNGMFINGGGPVTIGNYFHSGMECMIITQNHEYDDGEMIPYGPGYHYKAVVIEDFVWLGRRVTVLPGAHIGEGAIIQAGAVVHGEIPPYAIAGGNPAKVFKYRDIEHFQRLKAEGKVFSDKVYCELVYGDE